MEEAIRIQRVCKSFGARTVLEGIELRLERGKCHVLLGSSGCGKSTLLRLLLGLEAVTSGTITVDGIEAIASNQGRIAARTGYVVQEGALFPHLTAQANLTLPARIEGWSEERRAARLAELTRLGGLETSLLSRYPRELSGGQRQRVGLLRALMLDPAILLLDEPLGALDPISRSALQDELKLLFQELNKTAVLVTHDVREAAFFGDTVTLLHEGRVEQHGSFLELVERPKSAYVREFLRAQRPLPEMRGLQ